MTGFEEQITVLAASNDQFRSLGRTSNLRVFFSSWLVCYLRWETTMIPFLRGPNPYLQLEKSRRSYMDKTCQSLWTPPAAHLAWVPFCRFPVSLSTEGASSVATWNRLGYSLGHGFQCESLTVSFWHLSSTTPGFRWVWVYRCGCGCGGVWGVCFLTKHPVSHIVESPFQTLTSTRHWACDMRTRRQTVFTWDSGMEADTAQCKWSPSGW